MAVVWRVVERKREVVVLATDGATLLLEHARPASDDPELRGVIARLAPHLTFGPATTRGVVVERCATSSDERVVVGRLTRGGTSVAYLVSSRERIDVDDLLAEHCVDLGSPFSHLAD